MGEDFSEEPLVSIVTPSYNQGRFIEDTILSIKNQDYPNIEHIIVDGGSTDNTLEILKNYQGTYNLRWISESDEGQSDAINKGFRMVKGEIISWLNADDFYLKRDILSKIVKAFRLYKNADLVYGDSVFIGKNKLMLRVRCAWPIFNYRLLLYSNSLNQSAVFFRREIVNKYKLDKDLHFAMDYDFWLRVDRAHRFLYLNEILTAVTKHEYAKTVSQSDRVRTEEMLVKKRYGLMPSWRHYLLAKLIRQVLKIRGLTKLPKLWQNSNYAVELVLDSKLSFFFRQILRLRVNIVRQTNARARNKI